MLGGILRSLRVSRQIGRSLRNESQCHSLPLRGFSAKAKKTAGKWDLDDDVTEEEFGMLAKKKGVTVFRLPPELRLSKEKDDEEPYRSQFFSDKQPAWYFHRCKKLAKQRKWRECLDFFEDRMLQKDKVFPEESNYTVVIGALGRAGQAKKAFQLYKAMRERAIVPTAATYTALFNSVAQSPNREDLGRALGLYSKLHRHKIRMGRITYCSLMKVFGRHGTTEQMMGILRESITAGYEPDVNTFNTILQCMLEHKDDGLRKAIQVWRWMTMLDIKPDGKSIMYLLKIVKQCGIGDPDLAFKKLTEEALDAADYKHFFRKHIRNVYWLKGQVSIPQSQVLEEIASDPEMITLDARLPEFNNLNHDIGAEANACDDESIQNDKQKVDTITESSVTNERLKSSPNLLNLPVADRSPNSRLLNFKKDLSITERLDLIGGYANVLEMIEKYNVAPTRMLLSSLVWVMTNSREAENEIIDFAKKHRVVLDTDFYNAILRKCIYRNDFAWLGEILEKMVSDGLEPNYRTWSIVAMSCRTGFQGVSLIKQVREKDVQLDEVFFTSMLLSALSNRPTKIEGYKDVRGYDYRYLTRILREMKESNIKTTVKMITLLEKSSDWPEGYNRWEVADTTFERKVFSFRRRYKEWLDVTEMKDEAAL